MFVTDIEITHYQYCPKSARHMANVCLTLKTQIVTVWCKLELPADIPGPARASAFVQDALRQLRRMPEFRSGQSTVQMRDTDLNPPIAHLA
jgi:hypothetical protein